MFQWFRNKFSKNKNTLQKDVQTPAKKLTPKEKLQSILESIKARFGKGKVNQNKKPLFGNIKHEDMKKKFSLTKSKDAILKNMVEDHKKGKNIAVISKKPINWENIGKDEFINILNQFQANKAKNKAFFESIDKNKKTMSLTKSRTEILNKMQKEYKARKFSLSDIPNISKIDISDVKKENLDKILDIFKETNMKIVHAPFVKQSKFKQLKSDIGAKINK